MLLRPAVSDFSSNRSLMSRSHLTVWRPGMKLDVCENGFFQILKLKLHAFNFQQDFYPLLKLNIAWPWQHKNTFIKAFRSARGCQTCMCWHIIRFLGTHVFDKVPRLGDSEGTFSSQAATCYYQSNHSLVEAIPLSALLKDTTSELTGLPPH